jgi:hypothetical protein
MKLLFKALLLSVFIQSVAAQIELSGVQTSNADGESVPVFARAGLLSISEQTNAPEEGENRLVFAQIAS